MKESHLEVEEQSFVHFVLDFIVFLFVFLHEWKIL